MKTKLLIVALLVSVSSTAQVRNYKANQHELLNSFESDLVAGIGGAALASISFSIDLEKPFRH